MDIPESMKEELQAWNNGKGIDLESWIGCTGSFSQAVGYASLYCPKFVEFEDYIFQAEEVTEQLVSSVRGFESQDGSSPMSVEWVINHLHIYDVQYAGCPDVSSDKLIAIGVALKEIYEALLAYKFPGKPCEVKLYIPEDKEDYEEYQISFWQKRHATSIA